MQYLVYGTSAKGGFQALLRVIRKSSAFYRK